MTGEIFQKKTPQRNQRAKHGKTPSSPKSLSKPGLPNKLSQGANVGSNMKMSKYMGSILLLPVGSTSVFSKAATTDFWAWLVCQTQKPPRSSTLALNKHTKKTLSKNSPPQKKSSPSHSLCLFLVFFLSASMKSFSSWGWARTIHFHFVTSIDLRIARWTKHGSNHLHL